jgi:integrase
MAKLKLMPVGTGLEVERAIAVSFTSLYTARQRPAESEVINTAWNEVCRLADVVGDTPHDVRHAMGKHLIEKTGNLAAVQRQLGHTNTAYSMQYNRITDEELGNALEDR